MGKVECPRCGGTGSIKVLGEKSFCCMEKTDDVFGYCFYHWKVKNPGRNVGRYSKLGYCKICGGKDIYPRTNLCREHARISINERLKRFKDRNPNYFKDYHRKKAVQLKEGAGE